MSKKKDKKYYKTIKLEFMPDQYVETMLRKNCNYRHFLYNKCVDIVKSLEETHSKGHIGDFSKYDLLAYIRDLYESNIIYSYRDELRPEWMEEYDYYFRGISECVVDDIMTIIERIKSYRQEGHKADIHFMKFNQNKMSFKFKNKINKSGKNECGNRIELVDDNPYLIGVKINNTYGHPLGIRLKESFKHKYIDINTIKEIGFKFHNEKWYLCLIMDYDPYPEDYVEIRYEHKQKDLAGIDLGEENPVVIYDGKKIKKIPKHLQYPKERIKKVEKRISRLQAAMDRKYNPDMDRFHQSKNYYKVLKKFHKAWEHLINIKKDWHFKLAHWIVTHYKTIVVDEFKNHIININEGYTTRKRKDCNHSMLNKSMYDFTKRLIHMCHKYGTNYYKVIKKDTNGNLPKKVFETTNTCNHCGNINKIKLKIDETRRDKLFKCESCGYTINRDVNAAINCYNLYNNKSTKKLFLELI